MSDTHPQSDDRLAYPEWLREQYIERERSTREIAEMCGCSPQTISRHLKKHGIDTRDIVGEYHHNWDGGPAPYGRGWTEPKRRKVRERDDYECQSARCSMTQAEHIDEYGQKLHVHHLHKARDIDDPEERNKMDNLITLCRDCHARWEKIADAGLQPEVIHND